MTDLNPSSIAHLQNDSSNRSRTLRRAYRLLQVIYFGRAFLARGYVRPVATDARAIESQRLLYKEYLKKNLCSTNSSGLYFTPHTFLPTTTMLCVESRRRKLLGTSSIIGDGRLGLPADLLYKNELDEMRQSGRVLVEVGALALDGRKFRRGGRSLGSLRKLATMMTLFSGIFRYSYQHAGATHLVIMVNPSHESIYEFIGFERFSEVRHYPKVAKPAVPMVLDIEHTLSRCGDDLPSLCLVSGFGTAVSPEKYKFSALDIARRAELEPAFFSGLTESEAEAMVSEYPLFQPILQFLRSAAWADAVGMGAQDATSPVGDTLLALVRQAITALSTRASSGDERATNHPSSIS